MAEPSGGAGVAGAGGSDMDRATVERAAATKELLEARLKQRKSEMADRRARRLELNAVLADPKVDEATKKRVKDEFEARERDLLRESRKRYGPTDFEPLVVIGRGAFGEVKLVRSKEDGRVLAMKTMHKDAMIVKNQTAHVRAERDALAAAENPWVVNLHFSFQDDDNLYLVMDYCAGGDLMTLLIKQDVLPEAWAKFYAAEAIQAIASVHAMGYIHRDLKPDNFLFDHRGHLKLTDLGLCKKVDDEIPAGLDSIHESAEATAAALESTPMEPHHDRPVPAGFVRDRKLAYSTVGTPDYIDYQVLLKKGYGKEADWWSLGTVLYECLLGFPPFYGDDPVQTCRKILHYKTTLRFPPDRTKHLSPEAIDFLKCMITDADKRLGTKGGVEEVKAHPWFRGMDWDHLLTMDAPWQPPNGKVIGALLEKLSSLPRDHAEFAPTLRQLTSNFDDFSALAADDPRLGFPGGHGPEGGAAKSTKIKKKFVGYTFKRSSDGKPVLFSGASSDVAAVTGSLSSLTMSGAGASGGGAAK